MKFARAKVVGDEGERQVADALARIAPQYGMQVLNNVLLKVGQETAQIDHIAVDRYGVLVIESKVRTGALIKGRDVEHTWTALYPKQKPKTFQNPLKQNDQHMAILRRIMQVAGRPLDPDYVRSAVVFVGANISQLELDSLHRLRVIDVADLPRFIQDRHDFAPNPGNLDARAVVALADMIRELDKSGDAEVERAHADRARGRRRGKRAVDADEPVVWKDAGFASRMEDLSEVRSRKLPWIRRHSAAPSLLAPLVLIALLLGLGWYFYLGPGVGKLPDLAGIFGRGAAAEGPAAPSAPAPAPVAGPSVADAKAALLEVAPPDIIAAITNADAPSVTTVPQGTTFTWEYVDASGNAATVRTVAVTLDAAGQMVGASIE